MPRDPHPPVAGTSPLESFLHVLPTLAGADVGMAVIEVPGYRYLRTNERYSWFSGGVDVVGRTLDQVFPQTVAMGFNDLFDQVVATGEAFHGRAVQSFLPDTGEVVHIDVVFEPLRGADGEIVAIAQVLVDATPRVLLAEAATARAATARSEPGPDDDHLTGVASRRSGELHLIALIDEVEATGRSAFAAFVDIDGFKAVNDIGGHALGDEVLRTIAGRLGSVPDLASVARMGGDEFLVCMTTGCTRDEAARRIEAVLDVCRVPVEAGDHRVSLSASVGIGEVVPLSGETPSRLLRDVDEAMYQAKASGGDQAVWADGRLRAASMLRAETVAGLNQALDDDGISVDYQPIVDLSDGRVLGVEALARWDHPRRGRLDAAEFVGVAERAGLLVAIGQRTMDQAVAVFEDLGDRGVLETGAEGPRLFLNVTAHQLTSSSGRERIAAHAARGTRLCIELTETSLYAPSHHQRLALDELRSQDITLAVDDFGTGYSSLAYLQDLQPEVLKLDQRFVTHLHDDERARTMVSAVIQVARAFGMLVVAEGIETAEQAGLAQELGCEAGQGYHLVAPMEQDELERWLRDAPPHRLTKPPRDTPPC